jgi:hypothetical protein
MAFLRTGCLVSANGDDMDDHINPEGTAKVFTESTDEYYRAHGIKTFRDLLRCSDKQCGHVQQERAAIPVIAREQTKKDNAVVQRRFTELERSRDERAVLLVRVLQHGFMWAGSSFIVFISGGVTGLLDFLSETDEDGNPSHDIDLYRVSKTVGGLGKRKIGGKWAITGQSKKRSVVRFSIELKNAPKRRLELDQVNLFKSTLSPSTDMWSLCASYTKDKLVVTKLYGDEGPPVEVTLHNALRYEDGNATCYVLRRAVMPTYKDGELAKSTSSACDRR